MATNPYIQNSRAELYSATQARAGDLLAAGDDASIDTAHLLLALAMQLHDARLAASGGVTQAAGTLRSRYRARLDQLQRNARYEVLRAAADELLGGRADAWLQPGKYADSPYERALASNAGLAAILDELDALRK